MRSIASAGVGLAAAVWCASPLHAEGREAVSDCERSERCVVVRNADGDPVGFVRAGEGQSIWPPPPEAVAVAPDLMSVVPAPLVALSETTGCKVPTRRPKHGPPAWVFELAEGRGFVGWCQVDAEREGSVRSGILVSLSVDRHPWSSCPSHVPLPYYGAPEVFVIESHTTTLGGFWKVGSDGSQGEPVPADDPPASHLAIDLGHGGAETVILCHRGQWIMRGYD